MRPGCRFLSSLLCLTILASASGCSTSREMAESECRYLYPGMSMQEVADRLGNPTQVIQGEPGTETLWVYRFEGGPSAAATVVMVIFFVAILAAAIMSKGGGSFSGGGAGSDGPPCQIRVRFDGEGRLVDVTPLEPVPDP